MSRIIPLLAWGMAAVMLGHAEPLPAQDSSQAKIRAYQRQMEIEAALQERLARTFSEEMPQRMAEMKARLELELAPRLEELQMRLPEMLERSFCRKFEVPGGRRGGLADRWRPDELLDQGMLTGKSQLELIVPVLELRWDLHEFGDQVIQTQVFQVPAF